MTGTASTFNDFTDTDNINDRSRHINFFTSWSFGKMYPDCLLTDITRCGGSVLIPKRRSAPSAALDLLIISPENKDEIHTIIHAEQRWVDVDFSDKYKKIGLEFIYIDPLTIHAIDSVVELFTQQKNTTIKCNLVNC